MHHHHSGDRVTVSDLYRPPLSASLDQIDWHGSALVELVGLVSISASAVTGISRAAATRSTSGQCLAGIPREYQ